MKFASALQKVYVYVHVLCLMSQNMLETFFLTTSNLTFFMRFSSSSLVMQAFRVTLMFSSGLLESPTSCFSGSDSPLRSQSWKSFQFNFQFNFLKVSKSLYNFMNFFKQILPFTDIIESGLLPLYKSLNTELITRLNFTRSFQ